MNKPGILTIRVRLAVAILSAFLFVGVAPGNMTFAQVSPKSYVVKRGDTLYKISRVFHVSVQDLRAWNHLPDDRLRVGQRLRVSAPPPTPAPPQQAPPSPTGVKAPQPPPPVPEESVVPDDQQTAVYTIRPGETLYSIALRFGLSADSLFALNGGITSPLAEGSTLRLPGRFAMAPYRVRRGDNLSRIAARHGISLGALRRANDLTGDKIRVGQMLRVPTKNAVAPRDAEAMPEIRMRGQLLVYPETFAGRLTAGGANYDPDRFTVSHADLPLGSIVILTNPTTHRSTFAEVNDRGPLDPAYVMDASTAVARVLGITDRPDTEIEVRVVE